MYHHHSQQQGPQPFSNGPRPPHHQPPPNQHQNRSPSNMLSQAMGFQFPRPTQLPDELESALAIRGGRDIDHRLIDHMNRPNQHQNQGSGSGISQHGNYGPHSSDNQPGHQQGVDWSNYQPPTKLFASPPPSASHQSQRHQGPQKQPQSSHAGTSWTAPVSDSPSPQARHPHSGGGGSSGDGQALYTPESAGSILASFGLSNEDLEVLSHYPDDQLTPDTLPFILRDIQINKSGNPKTVGSTSSTSFPRSSPLARSHSPEVPSLLTVTQTAGKVIDYGHASRAKDESNSTRETFKREPLPSERTVKMYPSSSSSSAPKVEKTERRQVRLEHSESGKHGDRDYRRSNSDHRRSSRSPGREFPPASKSRNLDRDYRREGPKPRPPSETGSESSSRQSLSSSSGSKPYGSNKKLPTPTMISDFSAVSPKVYPHTCSLCHTQCDEEKDWVDHINTVNHTAACRDLRNKYPHWKPNLPSRSGRYGSRALWDPRDQSPSHTVSRSLSSSPPPSPSHGRHRVGPHSRRPPIPIGRALHHQPRHQYYTGGASRSGLKRPHDDSTKFSHDTSRHPSFSKAGHGTRHGPLQSSTKTFKSGTKPGTKTTKMSAKPPPAKKKKKVVTPASQVWSVAERLVYLTGIPKDASEQEVTDLVGSFGKINNVILMPCSEEESEKCEGQKASICMLRAEDAQALANSTNLSIKDQQITASVAKKPEAGQSSDANNSKPAPGVDKDAAGEDLGGEADQKTSDEKGTVLIAGLPESDWSESDIIKLVQPFGTPSDIILATQNGKALVSVPDTEIAQEMVKVHSFMPMKMNDSELKLVHVKQRVGLSTPVALYNLLMGSAEPLENAVPVGWSCLLVINNVPNTPSASSEVQKLVRRFGTVIKTLVLNNMVICEMATAAMALSVYKRFQTFPCIIQNNPLFFSRKPDPKANTQTKVIAAYLDSSEDAPANGKGSQAAAADEEETAHKENSDPPLEGIEKDGDEKEEKSPERTIGEDKALGEDQSKEEEIQKDELTDAPSDTLAAPDAKLEAEPKTDMKEKSDVETEMEMAEENKAPTGGNDETPAGEETKPSCSDGETASQEMVMPALPKVTQEMVNALLVECRTRTASNSSNAAASTNGDQGKTQVDTEQGEKTAEEKKEPVKNHKEVEVKKQERERKEREARKEKETREKERKERERERRAWEKEERTRRDRERDERNRRDREKREEERRERERRDRKRAYREGSSGSRSSFRSDGHRHSSWRDEHSNNSEAENKMAEGEEECDDFPFNMSDFVTVDEVGDVNDLPSPAAPSDPMETTEEVEDAPSSVQQDTPEETPMEVTAETTSVTTATLVQADEHVSESEAENVLTAETADDAMSSDLSSGPIIIAVASLSQDLQADASQTYMPTYQAPETEITPETDTVSPETEATLTAIVDSPTEDEPLPTPAPEAAAVPADSSSDSTAPGAVTSENEKDETEDSALNHDQAKKEEMVPDKTEEQEKMRDKEDKETAAPAVQTGNPERPEDQTNTKEECVSKESSLPPFDPSHPVGMEYLVPKTGFFCKVCNRFFTGAKEAEINHCKTLKHYENLQKYLQTTKTANVTAKSDST